VETEMRDGGFSDWFEFEEIIKKSSVSEGVAGDRRIVGILFMRKGQKITDTEILPSLTYFNFRSGQTDFVLAGWKHEVNSKEPGWHFDEMAFVKACDVINENTKWRYEGGTELLLFEARKGEEKTSGTKKHNTHSHSVYIDFSNALTLHLDTIMQKLSEPPQVIFERIFSFSRNYMGDSPLQGLSFQEARVSAVAAVVQGVIGYLPKEVKEQLEYARQFGVKDISKPSRSEIKVTAKHDNWLY
jgi:hypothetical protein